MILIPLALAAAAAAQPASQPAQPPSTCPTLSVATKSTDKAIFLDATPAIANAYYNWMVEAGTIVAGQGTPSIMISTGDMPLAIEVKVKLEVTNIAGCPKGTSIAGAVKRS